MERVPAIAGWHWIKQGFALFRKQPGELSTLFMLCCCLKLLLCIIPLLGVLLSCFILIPVFSQVFMVACNDVERGKQAHPRILFEVFRDTTVKRLTGLGACYLGAFLLAGVITSIFDGGYLVQALGTQMKNAEGALMPAANSPQESQLAQSLLVWIGAYLLTILPLWFASPLIAWRNMSIGKAMFFSFFSVLRAFKAFIVYAVSWFAIMLLVSFTIDAILGILQVENQSIAILILMPIYLVLTVITYCAYYASYVHIFGAPQREQQ